VKGTTYRVIQRGTYEIHEVADLELPRDFDVEGSWQDLEAELAMDHAETGCSVYHVEGAIYEDGSGFSVVRFSFPVVERRAA
jgi:hypothetical protein